MTRPSWFLPILTLIGLAGVGPASGQEAAPGASLPPLDQLVQEFGASANKPAAKVKLDAWVEGEGSAREVVIVLQPQGKTKLIADPGITVTPDERQGVTWKLALPHRHVDSAHDYFDPSATVRLPFETEDEQPIKVLVEFAYCQVEYQCFFGEETLSIANRID